MESKPKRQKRIMDRIKRIGHLRFRANLTALFILYSAIFVFVLLFYGFLNTSHLAAAQQRMKAREAGFAVRELADILYTDMETAREVSLMIGELVSQGVDPGSIENAVLAIDHINGIYVTRDGALVFKHGSVSSADIRAVSQNERDGIYIFGADGLLRYLIAWQGLEVVIIKPVPDSFAGIVDALKRDLLAGPAPIDAAPGSMAVYIGNDQDEWPLLYDDAPQGGRESDAAVSISPLPGGSENSPVYAGGYWYYSHRIGQTETTAVLSIPAAAMGANVDYTFVGVSTGIIIALMIFIYLRFRNSIYVPIKRIEHAMHVVTGGDDVDFEVDIDEHSELHSIAQYFNRMIGRLKEYANREYAAKMLRKQAELNALQSQINPHFLYNTLDSIRGLALLDGQENIAKMTKALSSLFKYSISKTVNLSTLGEEIKNVENYLTIQQYRFSGKFIVIKDIDLKDNPDILSYRLPKLTIQPIVENAIYHGLETKIGKGTIKLSAYTTEKRLVVAIEDDGTGIPQDKLERINQRLHDKNVGSWEESTSKSTGVAIVNVNERIQLYFGELYGLSVYSTPGMGTTVEIVVPLTQEDTPS